MEEDPTYLVPVQYMRPANQADWDMVNKAVTSTLTLLKVEEKDSIFSFVLDGSFNSRVGMFEEMSQEEFERKMAPLLDPEPVFWGTRRAVFVNMQNKHLIKLRYKQVKRASVVDSVQEVRLLGIMEKLRVFDAQVEYEAKCAAFLEVGNLLTSAMADVADKMGSWQMQMAIPGAHRIAAQANLVVECIETVIAFSRESLARVDDCIKRDIACY